MQHFDKKWQDFEKINVVQKILIYYSNDFETVHIEYLMATHAKEVKYQDK